MSNKAGCFYAVAGRPAGVVVISRKKYVDNKWEEGVTCPLLQAEATKFIWLLCHQQKPQFVTRGVVSVGTTGKNCWLRHSVRESGLVALWGRDMLYVPR